MIAVAGKAPSKVVSKSIEVVSKRDMSSQNSPRDSPKFDT